MLPEMAPPDPHAAVDLADCFAVGNIIGAYGWLFDDGDADGWAALWEEDGVFVADGEETAGRAALAGMVRTLFEQTGGQLRHLAGSFHHAYGESRETMIVRFYSHVSTWGSSPSAMMALCVMTLARGPAGWRIRRNDVRLLTADAA